MFGICFYARSLTDDDVVYILEGKLIFIFLSNSERENFPAIKKKAFPSLSPHKHTI